MRTSPFKTKSQRTIEQIVKPTGLIDSEIIVKPVAGQIDINDRVVKLERVLVTTLKKKMAKVLSEYLKE